MHIFIMNKKIALILLAASLFLLVREGVLSWQDQERVAPPEKEEKKKTATREPPKQFSFYPQVPAKLPDLRQGYLFNEDRLLVSEEQKKEDDKIPEPSDGIKVDMDQLYYAGSIILGDTKKALVTYVDLQGQKVKTASKSKVKRESSRKKKYARLQVNDKLGGYTVTEIEKDHITFERGGKRIEKSLYDSSKDRIKPPTRKKVVSRKKVSTSSKKKVSLGTPRKTRKTVTSKSVRTPKVVQSKRVRTPSRTSTRNIQPPVSQ